MESDNIHLGHVTDDLVDTWSDSPPAGNGVGASLSYWSVLAPHLLPHTGSRCVTLGVVDLSNSQRQGVAVAVSSPPHVSLTPAPPGSLPTVAHLVTVGSVPHARAPGFSELPTFNCPDCNDAVFVNMANDRPWRAHQDTTDLDRAIPESTATE